jgi:hypothetical protein
MMVTIDIFFKAALCYRIREDGHFISLGTYIVNRYSIKGVRFQVSGVRSEKIRTEC